MLLCLWAYSYVEARLWSWGRRRVVGVPEDRDRLRSWQSGYDSHLHAGKEDPTMLGGSILQEKEDSPYVDSWLYVSVDNSWLVQLSSELILAFMLSVASSIQEIDSHRGPEVVDHLTDAIAKCGLFTDLGEEESKYHAHTLIVPPLVRFGVLGFHPTWKAFMQTCTYIHLEDDFVLVADCVKCDGTTHVSKLNLQEILCSKKYYGDFEWGHDGDPLKMLDNIRKTSLGVAENVVFEAEVLVPRTGVWAQARIDLLERIVNIDGNLQYRSPRTA